MRFAIRGTSSLVALLILGSVFAQGADNYPSRPVTVVVPAAPGASSGIEGRVYTNKLSETLRQQLVMDFKPGAVMQIGMNHALKQKPDGYTTLPDLATASEQGVPDFEYSSWLGFIAPGKTPAPIINKLQAEIAKIIKLPEIQAKFGDETMLIASTPAEFRKHAITETARWRRLVQQNNIKLESN